MYFLVVVLTMVLLPVACVLIEWQASDGADPFQLMGKWIVFWGIGVRLLLAGAVQVARPSFTARGILGVESPGARTIVVELGTTNLVLGLIGLLSLWISSWTPSAALAGGLYLGVAGVMHARSPHRNAKETVAMVTDLFVFLVAAVYLASLVWRAGGR